VKHPIAGENATHLNRGRERLTSDLRVRSPPDICFSRRRLSLYAAAQLSAEPTIACLRTWSVSRRPPGTVANGSRREVTGDDTQLTRYPIEQCLRTARSRWTETSLKSAESAFQHESCPRGPRRSTAPRGERFVYALANRLRYSTHLESDDRPYSCPQARLARERSSFESTSCRGKFSLNSSIGRALGAVSRGNPIRQLARPSRNSQYSQLVTN